MLGRGAKNDERAGRQIGRWLRGFIDRCSVAAQRPIESPVGNAVKHFLAVGREPSGVSGTIRDRRACALPRTPRQTLGINASQRCRPGSWSGVGAWPGGGAALTSG